MNSQLLVEIDLLHAEICDALADPKRIAILYALREGTADLGVVAGTADLVGLEVQPFQRDRLVLLVPPGHRLGSRRRIAFAEALGEPFVALDAGAAIQTYIASQAERLGRVLSPRIRLRNFEAVGRMVAAGVGVAVVSAATFTRSLRDAGVRALELNEPWAVRDLVLCLPAGRLAPPLARRLAAALPRRGFDLS